MRLTVLLICWFPGTGTPELFNSPCASGLDPLKIPAHGKYSSEYIGDWSKMPDGKGAAKKDLSSYRFKNLLGDELKRRYIYNKASRDTTLQLKNFAFKVKWRSDYDKYKNTLFLVRGYKKVVVDNIAVIQLDPDYRASQTLLIEDCYEVVIRNSYFSGTNNNYHLRIEGCQNVFIDGVEISGYDYGELGTRCGGGVLINNGDPKVGGKNGMVSPNPIDMKWCVVQNCYVHDCSSTDSKRNQDGINIQSAADGIVFNCYFENWTTNDAVLDISHRRYDLQYKNHTFRVERNKFLNCRTVKTPGKSSETCRIVFANNIYRDTYLTDYHTGEWSTFHIHETFHFTKNYRGAVFFKTYGIGAGKAQFSNCVIFSENSLYAIYFLSGNSTSNDMLNLRPDYCAYFLSDPVYWVKTKETEKSIKEFGAWKKTTGSDAHSVKQNPKNCFKKSNADDYRLLKGCAAFRIGADTFLTHPESAMKIDRDFNGHTRSTPLSAGAIEEPSP